MLADRKKQNADLNGELDRQRAALNEKNVDIQRSKHDLSQLQDLNQSLNNQKRKTEDELACLRDRNREDLEEIDRLTNSNNSKAKESSDLTQNIRHLEYEISKSINKIEDFNRIIDAKISDIKSKEKNIADAENEIAQLKNQ